jgi:hypothetical protein
LVFLPAFVSTRYAEDFQAGRRCKATGRRVQLISDMWKKIARAGEAPISHRGPREHVAGSII